MPDGLTAAQRLAVRAAWLDRKMKKHARPGSGAIPYMPLALSGGLISTGAVLGTGAVALALSIALPGRGERILAADTEQRKSDATPSPPRS
jgi:hypothetical protein